VRARTATVRAWAVHEGDVSPSGLSVVSVQRDPSAGKVRIGYSDGQGITLTGERTLVTTATVPRPSAGCPAMPSGRGAGRTARPGCLPAADRPACAATPGAGPATVRRARGRAGVVQFRPSTVARAVALSGRLTGPEVVSWRGGRPRAARCHVCGQAHALSETGRILLRHGPPCPGGRSAVQLVQALAALQARRSGPGCRG